MSNNVVQLCACALWRLNRCTTALMSRIMMVSLLGQLPCPIRDVAYLSSSTDKSQAVSTEDLPRSYRPGRRHRVIGSGFALVPVKSSIAAHVDVEQHRVDSAATVDAERGARRQGFADCCHNNASLS
jgi:hypothetical protein